jgi:hypothetical protein
MGATNALDRAHSPHWRNLVFIRVPPLTQFLPHSPHIPLVRRRSVDRRHRNVVKAQIHAELRAMMNQVIHAEAPQHCNPRHAQQGLSGSQERPVLHQMFVAGIRDCPSSLFTVLRIKTYR